MFGFVKIFDYLLETKIGNAIAVIVGALFLYGLFKLVVKIIDYFVFKKLMKSILDAVYSDGSEDGERRKYENLPNSHHEDEQSQKKDKKREQLREAERIVNMENDIRSGQIQNRPRVYRRPQQPGPKQVQQPPIQKNVQNIKKYNFIQFRLFQNIFWKYASLSIQWSFKIFNR